EAEEEQRDHLGDARNDVVDGVQPHGREPVEVARAVMDGVEAPQKPAVEEPVHPVADEVAEEQHFQDLEEDGLAAHGTALVLDEGLYVLPVERQAEGDRDDDDGGDDAEPRDRLGHERREEPVRDVGEEAAAPDLLSGSGRPGFLERPEKDTEQKKADDHARERGARLHLRKIRPPAPQEVGPPSASRKAQTGLELTGLLPSNPGPRSSISRCARRAARTRRPSAAWEGSSRSGSGATRTGGARKGTSYAWLRPGTCPPSSGSIGRTNAKCTR